MKKPEEIKKGNACCGSGSCDGCPYRYAENDNNTCCGVLTEDTLTYIQQLESQVPRWISVEERVPERHGQMVVGLYNQHGASKSLLFPYVFTWYAYGSNGYVNGPHFSDEGFDGLKVHYWMPLPEAPKEEHE